MHAVFEKRWLTILFFILCFSCSSPERKETDPVIEEAKQIIQPGDLLLRAGTSYASENIRELSQTDKSYSHVGIAVEEKGALKVCSIEPVDDTSPTDSIRYEAIEKFLNPAHNSAFAVYRYNLSISERSELLSRIETYYKKGIVFDPVFIYDTNEQMYCSEMISKALDSATNGRIRLETSYITNKSAINSLIRHFKKFNLTEKQIRERPVVLIDNVYTHPECTLIKKFEFKK